MAAAIHGNQLETIERFKFGVAEQIAAPHARVGHPAVNENDWLALPFGDITNFYAAGVERFVSRVGGPW
jgi:hypothetical protein